MAIQHGGQSKYLLLNKKYYSIQKFIAAATIYAILIITLSKFGNYFFRLSGVLALLFCLGIAVPPFIIAYKYFKKKEGNFAAGLRGEGNVYYALSSLSDDHIIFQDVRLTRRGNIDFIVLAPTGVFALEVKANSGYIEYVGETLFVNKRPVNNMLGQARSGAAQLSDVLNIKYCNPVLVITSNNTIIDKSVLQCNSLKVIHIKWLKSYITNKTKIYSFDELKNFESILISVLERKRKLKVVKSPNFLKSVHIK